MDRVRTIVVPELAGPDPLPLPWTLLVDLWRVDGGRHRHLRRELVHNLVTTAGRNLIRDFMYGDAVTGLERFAIGTDGTTPAASDAALGAEVLRAAFTDKTKGTGELTLVYYLGSASANGNTLREVGVFGNGATSTPGSGTLYLRAVHSPIEKNASLAITYTIVPAWGV